MSKYTTEVRFICEEKSGLSESKGCDDVDNIIANSWNKIFTTNCDFFDEEYRSILCSKILKHYYLREIGCETVGIWKLWMNTRLEEIMPYYNKLYLSAMLEINPFNDVDYRREHEGESDGTKNIDGTSNSVGVRTGDNDGTVSDVITTNDRITDNVTKTTQDAVSRSEDSETNTDIEKDGSIRDDGNYTDTGTVGDARDITKDGTSSYQTSKTDRYSDTPQGTINNTDVVGDAYLTNVRIIGENGSDTSHDEMADNNLQTRNLAGTTDNTRITKETENGVVTGSLEVTENRSGNESVNGVKVGVKGSEESRTEHGEFTENNRVNSENSSDEVVHNTDSFVEHVFGKMSTRPYSELLMKFRETFLNIDLMVIEEFSDLFLRLW